MNEMLRRLNEQPPTHGQDPIALTIDALAGPAPIKDAADYLEGLARRLH